MQILGDLRSDEKNPEIAYLVEKSSKRVLTNDFLKKCSPSETIEIFPKFKENTPPAKASAVVDWGSYSLHGFKSVRIAVENSFLKVKISYFSSG